MAQKRMFSKDVISNDNFLEMPDSSQNLYFHLSMVADDDGFISNYKSIMRMLGKKEDDLKVLLAKQFIIMFENGVLVIRHWRLNNYIQKDRYKETIYKEQKAQLRVDDSNVYNLDTECIHSIDKSRLDKSRLEEKRIEEKSRAHSNKKERLCFGVWKRVKLTLDEYKRLKEEFGAEFIDKKIKQLDEYVESNNNKNRYTNFNLVLRKAIKQKWFEDNTKEAEPSWLNNNIESQEMTEDEQKETKELLKGVLNVWLLEIKKKT